MRLTWKKVDEWREERGMEKAELSRASGIPERTIYSGIRNESKLNAATKKVVAGIFPEKFSSDGAPIDGGQG